MKITVNDHLELALFNKCYAPEFFDSIHQPNSTDDRFVKNLQRKYDSLEKVLVLISNALEKKFQVDGTPDFFVISEDQIAGGFEFHPLNDSDSIEIGFWLFPKFRGKGILTSAFPMIIEYASQHFSKEKIVAITAIENEAAQRLLERSGFERGGETEEPLTDGTIEKQFLYELPLRRTG